MTSSGFVAPILFGTLGNTFLQSRSEDNLQTAPLCLHTRKRPSRCSTFPLVLTPTCNADVGESATFAAPKTSALTWAVGRSSEYKAVDAVKEAVARASGTIAREGVQVDLVVIFIKSRNENTPGDEIRRAMPMLKKTLAMRRVLKQDTIIFGCTTASYIESEDDPSVNVALAHFPAGTVIQPFSLSGEKSFDIDWSQKEWHDLVGVPPSTAGPSQTSASTEGSEQPVGNLQLFLLEHPEFGKMRDLLSGLDFAYPGVRKFGGMAGRAHPLNKAYLFDSDGIQVEGVIGLALSSPDLQVDVTVAQGARGVGPLMEVVQVKDGNEICRVREVGTASAAEAAPMTLLDMWSSTDLISQEDRAYARRYLLFGVEVQTVADIAFSSMSTGADKKEKGAKKEEDVEMVIRKVVGFNEATKSLAVEGGDVRLGSRVQFQIRDEEAARSELILLFNKLMLEGSSKAMAGMSLMGALLLVDTERGANLYGNVTPDLDRALYTERFPVPMALLASERQIGPLPAGGLLGSAGDTFTLSASALYISFYGRTAQPSSENPAPEEPPSAESE